MYTYTKETKAEIDRLHAINAELVAALQDIESEVHTNAPDAVSHTVLIQARAALAKARGE